MWESLVKPDSHQDWFELVLTSDIVIGWLHWRNGCHRHGGCHHGAVPQGQLWPLFAASSLKPFVILGTNLGVLTPWSFDLVDPEFAKPHWDRKCLCYN